MFAFAGIARHAKYAKLSRILCIYFTITCLVSVPIGLMLIRDPPAVFYPRIHGGPDFNNFSRDWADNLTIISDENGFISDLEIIPSVFYSYDTKVLILYDYNYIPETEHYMFVITPEFLFYIDNNSFLGLPIYLLPAWVLEDMFIEEIFNHLALYNAYFTSIVAPVFLLVFIIFFVSQSLIMFAAVWLFGHWVKLSGNMSTLERFSVCTFSYVPAGLIGFVTGIFLPVLHIFIAQLVMIYISYKSIKEFWNI